MKFQPYHPFRSEEAKTEYFNFLEKKEKRWPVVSEDRMVKTSFGETFVRVSGPEGAPPFALLPGAGATSYIMTPNIESFSKDYRTYAVDQIFDYGRSVYAKPIKSPEDYVAWLDELFTALDLGDNINLMGGSLGGWQAAIYALHNQERLNKLVLLAPGATILPYKILNMLRLLLMLLPFRSFTKSTYFWIMADFAAKDESGRELVAEMVDEFMLSKRCFKAFRPMAPLPTAFSDGELQAIQNSTLVLYGENEIMYSPYEALARIKKIAPGIKSEIFPNAGHDLNLSQAEIMNEKVVDFLKNPKQ